MWLIFRVSSHGADDNDSKEENRIFGIALKWYNFVKYLGSLSKFTIFRAKMMFSKIPRKNRKFRDSAQKIENPQNSAFHGKLRSLILK